ncbi:MAG: AAA family ATPase, partial [Bacteroidetes bacterium]|nr:AAA family ATPase [Bacteroidota bacterium]
MYCKYFGFSEKPFDVTPDPHFLYLTPDHDEALASILYGIQERRGFITIVGEVGTGKTTLLNAVLDRLTDKSKVAYITNTDINFKQMLNMSLYEWGLLKDNERLSKVDAIHKLNSFAIRQTSLGGNVVLIIDEAQLIDNSTLEKLRLLSNLETRKYKLVQIVLFGQPELDIKLGQHELRQFTQRISLKRYISPLSKKETLAYLQHRIEIAQPNGIFPFTKNAQQLIWEYSGGIPRKINMLCDNSFLVGYGLKKKKI